MKATMEDSEEVIEKLKDATSYLYEFDKYKQKFQKAGISPGEIDSIEDFRSLPTMTPEDLAEDFQNHPPFGSLIPESQSIVRSNFTPSRYMDGGMPVIFSEEDIRRYDNLYADAFRSVGISEEDIVLNTGGTSPYPFGWHIAGGVETVGATHLPTGPGDSDKQVQIINDYDVTAIIGFPSFIMEIARSAEGVLDNIDIIIGGGEPFTAIEGYREEVREAFGGDVTVADIYGLAEAGFVAHESGEEAGMHVLTELFFPEVIDPETGELVDMGERGELVLTSLSKECAPVLRLRTGDLTILDEDPTSFGEYLLPRGVFGRTDSMKKVKGVKIYPDEVLMYLAGIEGIDANNVQFRITRPTGTTDSLTILISTENDKVNKPELAKEIESRINISIDSLELKEDFSVPEDMQVVDERV
jgi:phenylacetate-CoA ligase